MKIIPVDQVYATTVPGRGHCLIVDPVHNPGVALDSSLVNQVVQTPDALCWHVLDVEKETGVTLAGCVGLFVTEFSLPI